MCPRSPCSLAGIWGIWGSSPAEAHIWIPLAHCVPSWLRRMYSMPEELLVCGLAAPTGYQSRVAAGPWGGASWALHHRAAAPAAGSSRLEQEPFSRHSVGGAAKEPAKLAGTAPADPLLLISGSLSAPAPPTCPTHPPARTAAATMCPQDEGCGWGRGLESLTRAESS